MSERINIVSAFCHICQDSIEICLACDELKLHSKTNDILICFCCCETKGMIGRIRICNNCSVGLISSEAFDKVYYEGRRVILA